MQPFIQTQGDPKYQVLSKGITAMIITDLASIPGLKVLERSRIQKLIDEIKLSQSGLVDEEGIAVRAGKIMKAEKMVMGNYAIDE